MADEFDADGFLSEIGVEETDTNTHVVKLLRKQLKEMSKQLKDAGAQIQTFESEKAKASLDGTWKELGVPEVLREDYRGEQNPDAVKTWWEARKGFYNIPAEQQTTEGTQQQTQQAQDLQAVTQAANLGQDQAGNLSLEAFKQKASELARSRPSKNPHALDDLLNSFGMKAGPMDFPNM